MHPQIETPFGLPVGIIAILAIAVIGVIIVFISANARKEADKDGISQEEQLNTARQVEKSIKRSGYEPKTFYKPNSNIVAKVDYSNPKEPTITSMKRDDRFAKDGAQKLTPVETPEPEKQKGKPLDARRAKKAEELARKQRQKEQAAAALLAKNQRAQQNRSQQGQDGRKKK